MKTTWYEFTAEPAVFVYTFAVWTYMAVVRNFIEEKTCSPEVEPPLGYTCNDTGLLEQAEELLAVRSSLVEVLPALALLMAGCFKDSTGLNKPMMYVALAGEVIGVSIEVFAAWKWTIPIRNICISEALLLGAAGGSKLFYMGAVCVITDRSKPKDRTSRLTLNLAAGLAGACLSTGFSRHYLKHIDHKMSFVLIIVLHLITIALVFFIFEDRSKLMKTEQWRILDKLKTVFQSRINNKVIWLMIVSSALINTTTKAEDNLFPYYLHKGFGVSFKQAGFHLTYQLMISVASAIALPRLLSTFLKKSDFNIAIVSSAMEIISSTTMSLATTRVELLIIALLGFAKCFLFTIPLSIITRSVNEHEIGVYLSLCYIGQCIFSPGFYYLYNTIFMVTSKTMPGAYYLASVGVAILLTIFYRIALSIYICSDDCSDENSITAEADMENCGNCQENKVKF